MGKLTLDSRLLSLEQQLFVNNVYSEVENREFILATDHGCSLVLEKLLNISSDFELRVLFDKFNGRFSELFTHRFASHVCQTLLTLAADVVERECKGESIPGPDEVRKKESVKTQEDLGELLSMEKLFLSMCEVGFIFILFISIAPMPITLIYISAYDFL